MCAATNDYFKMVGPLFYQAVETIKMKSCRFALTGQDIRRQHHSPTSFEHNDSGVLRLISSSFKGDR
jgi:hypothetical protein